MMTFHEKLAKSLQSNSSSKGASYKPHAKNPPMGSTGVRPIGGFERGAGNGAFSRKNHRILYITAEQGFKRMRLTEPLARVYLLPGQVVNISSTDEAERENEAETLRRVGLSATR